MGGKRLESTGQIEAVALEGELLRLEGWAASGHGPVRGFELAAGGQALRPRSVETGRPRPDLPRYFPSLAGAGESGFRVLAPLAGAEAERAKGGLLRLTPLLDAGPGRDLLGVFEPRVAPPSPEDLQLVSPNLLVGFEFLDHAVELGGLRPSERVLDVGCGVGRMAFPLVHYLEPPGGYEGFDVVSAYVEAARRAFAAVPGFRFRHADVRNDYFNPEGRLEPTEFPFPYEDAAFDFVLLASVFTHMRPPELRHYLDELARVTRPGARVLCTVFLLNEEARRHMAGGAARLRFEHALGECRVASRERPEQAVAYEEEDLRRWLAERGLALRSVHPGAWCGRPLFTSYQDLLVVEAAPGGRS